MKTSFLLILLCAVIIAAWGRKQKIHPFLECSKKKHVDAILLLGACSPYMDEPLQSFHEGKGFMGSSWTHSNRDNESMFVNKCVLYGSVKNAYDSYRLYLHQDIFESPIEKLNQKEVFTYCSCESNCERGNRCRGSNSTLDCNYECNKNCQEEQWWTLADGFLKGFFIFSVLAVLIAIILMAQQIYFFRREIHLKREVTSEGSVREGNSIIQEDAKHRNENCCNIRHVQETLKCSIDSSRRVKFVQKSRRQKTGKRVKQIGKSRRNINFSKTQNEISFERKIDQYSAKDTSEVMHLEHPTPIIENETQNCSHLTETVVKQFSGNHLPFQKDEIESCCKNDANHVSEMISLRGHNIYNVGRGALVLRQEFFGEIHHQDLFERSDCLVDFDKTNTERKVVYDEFPSLDLLCNTDSNQSVQRLKLPDPSIHRSEETVPKGLRSLENITNFYDFHTGYPLYTESTNYDLSTQKLSSNIAFKSECTIDSENELENEKLKPELNDTLGKKADNGNLITLPIEHTMEVTNNQEISNQSLKLEMTYARSLPDSQDSLQKDTCSSKVSSTALEEKPAPAESYNNTRSLDNNPTSDPDSGIENAAPTSQSEDDFDGENPDNESSNNDSCNDSRESTLNHDSEQLPKCETTDSLHNESSLNENNEMHATFAESLERDPHVKVFEESENCNESDTREESLMCQEDHAGKGCSDDAMSHVGVTVPFTSMDCNKTQNKSPVGVSCAQGKGQEYICRQGKQLAKRGKRKKRCRKSRQHGRNLSLQTESSNSLEQKQEYTSTNSNHADTTCLLGCTKPFTHVDYEGNSLAHCSFNESRTSNSYLNGKEHSNLDSRIRHIRGISKKRSIRNKDKDTSMYETEKRDFKGKDRKRERKISKLQKDKSLDLTSAANNCKGNPSKKFYRVCHCQILKSDIGCEKHKNKQDCYPDQGSFNKSSFSSKSSKPSTTPKMKPNSLNSTGLVHNDSGFVSGQSIETFPEQSPAKLLYDCFMKEMLLEQPTSDFYQQLKVLRRVLADEERRHVAKEISRELYIEHRNITIFGLSDYFDRLNNGPPLTTRERMQYEWLRLASFHNYTGNGNALALARNGFYHDETEGSMFTRCYLCEASSSTWEMFDDISTEHRRQFPNCPFHGNSEEESLNISISTESSSEQSAGSSASTQNTAVRSVSTISSSTTRSSGSSVPTANSTDPTSTSSSQAIDSIARGFEGTQISQAQIHSSGAESISQQPTEDRDNRDRSLLALSQPRTLRALGRTGNSYSTIIAPRKNNVATGARSNVGLETSGSGSSTSGTPGQLPGQNTEARTPVSTATEALQGNSAAPPAAAPTSGTEQAASGSGPGGRADTTSTVVINNPKHPDYLNIDARINSYVAWPDYLDQTPRQMSEAGFFFVGVADFTRCFCCGGGLRNWEPGDDPMLEHTRWFPRCEYVNKLKGERYVAAVQRRHQEHMAEQQRQQIELAQRRDENRNPQDPMTTDAAAVMREMGYSVDRTREAILAVRQQTGSSVVTTQQVLTWLLDDEDRRTNGSRPPTSTSVPSSVINTSVPSSIIYTGSSIASSLVHTGTSIGTSIVNATSSISTATSIVSAGTTTSTVSSTSTETTAKVQQTVSPTTAQTGNQQTEGSQAGTITGAMSNSSSSSGGGSVEKQSGASGGDSDESKSTATEGASSSAPTGKSTKKKNAKKKAKSKAGTQSETAGATGEGIDAKSLKAENEKLREMQTCKICMERPVNTTLLPCGHLVCCESCASRLQRCPICRKRIKGTVKTFMS